MLVDAHCHPTETDVDVDMIKTLGIQMAAMTTNFEDIDKVASLASTLPDLVTPAFGLHPWFSHLVTDKPQLTKFEHYQEILEPTPQNESEIKNFPEPHRLADYLHLVDSMLENHPAAMVGEIGLDKAFRLKINGEITKFRIKLDHQLRVLNVQLQLAVRHNRPISLHGVHSPQALFDAVKKSGVKCICLHSYTGTGEFLCNQWLKLNAKVYVSISELVNGRMKEAKLVEILNTLPPDCVLTESDYHASNEYQKEIIEKVVERLAAHYKWTYTETLDRALSNYRALLAVTRGDREH